MFRPRSRFGTLAVLLVAGSVLGHAQSATTGAVQVTVKDAAGAPVPDATVRIISGQITRTVVSGRDGRAYFPLMNPGPWQIAVTKAGMATTNQTISLAVGETKPVGIKIAKDATATVEVVAAASTIDQTTTTTGSTFGMDTLDQIPKGRDVTQLAFLAPGVSSGGFTTNGLGISINGASGAENSYSIDGLSSTDFRYGGSGASFNTDFIDQIDIQTGGYKPEYSAMGGLINTLTKSGSNDFQGSLSVSTTPSTFFPAAKRTPFAMEQNQASGTDLATWVGGAMVKDKLFYSVGAYRKAGNIAGQTNFSGFTGDDTKITTEQYFVKLNWYLTLDQQLTFGVTHTGFESSQKHGVPLGNSASPTDLSPFGNSEQGSVYDINTNGASLGYDWTITSTMFLSAKVGQFRLINWLNPTAADDPVIYDRHWFQGATGQQSVPGGGAGTLPAYLSDTTTIYQRGGFGLYTHEYDVAKQGNLNLTWILGDHSLKVGFSDQESAYSLWERVSGDHRFTIDRNGGRLRDRFISNDSTVKSVYQAAYLQDTWQVTPAFNVFYGARAENQWQVGSNGRKFLDFKAGDYLQPRIGFTWDIKGNGKSKLSGNYAIYYETIPQRMAIREFGGEKFVENRYKSTLAGGLHNYVYSAANMNTPGTYNTSVDINGNTYDQRVDYGASFNYPPVQEGIKLPRRQEIQLGYQETYSSGWSAGVTFKYKKLENAMEDSVFVDGAGNLLVDRNGLSDNATLGGEPAVIWNPGSTLKYWGLHDYGTPSAPDVRPYYYDFTGVSTRYPKAFNKYRALEFTLEKKTDRYYFSANYVLSKFEGNYQGLVSSSNGQGDANITASFDFWPYVGTGLLPLDHTHTLKVFGSYRFDLANHALTLGANFFAQTGNPISHFDDGTATFGSSVNDFGSYGNNTPVNLQLGQFGRRPTVTRLDLHGEMEFAFTKKIKLMPYVDVLNAYNARMLTGSFEQMTDSGGSPEPAGYLDSAKSWQTGRSFRFGAKLRF